MDYLEQFHYFLKTIKNYSPNTITSYIKDVTDFANFLTREELAASPLDVRRERIARYYLSFLGDNGFSKKSISRKISSLRTFYNYMTELGEARLNIFTNIETPKVPKRLPKVISESEIQVLFDAIDQSTDLGFRNYLILDLLFSLGLRASELTNIEIADINIARKQILIHGKGSKDRYLPIHDEIINSVRHYLTEIRPRLIALSDSDTKILLLNYKGTPLTPRGLQVIVKKMLDDAEETYRITPHMLRHSFATTMLNNGADLRVVQELLGHEHLKSTQIYTEVSNKTLQEKFNALHPRKDEPDEDR